MHLLYARFFTKALRDLNYLNFDEPFKSLIHQGLILGPDGNKMSKSKGNVISPDNYIKDYGSDVLRLYLMFGFSYIEGGPWNDDGIKSAARFLDRVERIVLKYIPFTIGKNVLEKDEKELDYIRNYTIQNVTLDMENFSFNTAVARIMEFVNAVYKYDSLEKNKNIFFIKETLKDLILLLAPIAPHFCEELWEKAGEKFSIFNYEYPKANEKALIKQEVEIAVQINSKLKSKMNVPAGIDNKELEKIILNDVKIKTLIDGKTVKKVIIIPERLANILI